MRVSQSDKGYHQLSNMYSEHCEFSGGGQSVEVLGDGAEVREAGVSPGGGRGAE